MPSASSSTSRTADSKNSRRAPKSSTPKLSKPAPKTDASSVTGPMLVYERPPVSTDQERMLNPAKRITFVGAGTKTGKTVACAIWALEGILQGQRVAWIGPWHKRTRTGFEHIGSFLREWIAAGYARAKETDLSIDVYQTTNGRQGHLECFSGDNPDSVYGDGFDRVVMDEATRQPEATFHAARSTITATGGKMLIAFNTDRGLRHWAIREFFRAQRDEEPSYGWLTMPTAASPYVRPEDVEQAKRTLPDRVFRALYLAEVSEDGAGVFADPRSCIAGSLLPPVPGRSYVIGLDLARTHDFTVVTVMDRGSRHVVHWDRWHGLPWKVIRDKVAALAKKYNNAKVALDATGLGDPNAEELQRAGVWVEPVVFSMQSKRDLVERLVVAIEQRQITYPDLPILISELETFEFQETASGNLKYGAAEGSNDDAVASLCLAVRALGPLSQATAARALPIVEETFVSSGGFACL